MDIAREVPSLPEEVVAEILSRLPVKPLLRFRCVSKFWCSLIDSKHFVRSHLERSWKHPNFAQHRIIAQSVEPSERLNPALTLRHFSLPSLLDERTAYVSEFDDPLCASNDMRLVGSCDGLICVLSSTNKFFLWNPSTRIFRQLPCVDDELICRGISEFGFGADEFNGDYKVFCLLIPLENGYEAIGKVYSLKTNCWRRISYVDGGLLSGVGRFVSGKLHWLGTSCDDSRMDIITFYLEKEVYGMIQLPYHIDFDYYLEEMILTLGIVEESICVLCSNLRSKLDIWVMKQYGVKESWTKVMTIPYVIDSLESSFLMPLFLGHNGEILLVDWPSFLIYSPKDKWAWNPFMSSPYNFYNVHVYIESLVSPCCSGEL